MHGKSSERINTKLLIPMVTYGGGRGRLGPNSDTPFLFCLSWLISQSIPCVCSSFKGKGGIKIGEEGSTFVTKKKPLSLTLCAEPKEESKREKGHQWGHSLLCAELGTGFCSRKNPKRCHSALRLYFRFLNVGTILVPQTQPSQIFLASFISRPVKAAPPVLAELEQVKSAKRIHMSSGLHCSEPLKVKSVQQPWPLGKLCSLDSCLPEIWLANHF